MGTALTSAIFPLSDSLTLPLTWRSTVAFLGFTNDSVSLKLILSHGEKALNTYNVVHVIILAIGSY